MPKMSVAERAAAMAELADTGAPDEPTDELETELEQTAAGLGLTAGYRFAFEDPATLSEHPKNANRGDVDAIGASLITNGFYGAVVAQESTRHILAGNHRYREAVRLGLDRIPTIWVDVDAVDAVRIMLADNETARRGQMDLGAQDALIQELREVDPELKGTGFDLALEKLAAEEAEAEREAAEADEDDEDEPDYPEFSSKYGVIVMCQSEAHQAEVYEALASMGLGELRVVAV